MNKLFTESKKDYVRINFLKKIKSPFIKIIRLILPTDHESLVITEYD